MKIVMRNPASLKPYEKNAKIHPPEQIKRIANSIMEFGWRQPIVITANSDIVAGEGRHQAALFLCLESVPCTPADDLTDEQIKAYRLADNKVSESYYDTEILQDELLSLDFDMSDFGFEFDEIFDTENYDRPAAGYKETKNLDNFFRTDFEPGENHWGIPETKPFTEDLSGIEWILFGEKAKITNPQNTGIHFYIDDYKFKSVWTTPDKWLKLFQQCRAVVSPDFSNYTDMPYAQQIWHHYMRQWCARYWQDRGVNVVSSLSWAQGQIEDWTFAGIPQGTTVATSFVCDAIDKSAGIEELLQVIKGANPCKIYIKANTTDEKLLREYLDFEIIQPYNWGG